MPHSHDMETASDFDRQVAPRAAPLGVSDGGSYTQPWVTDAGAMENPASRRSWLTPSAPGQVPGVLRPLRPVSDGARRRLVACGVTDRLSGGDAISPKPSVEGISTIGIHLSGPDPATGASATK